MGKIRIFVQDEFEPGNSIELFISTDFSYSYLLKLIETKMNIKLSEYNITLNGEPFRESSMKKLINDSVIKICEKIDTNNIIKECFINTKFIESDYNEDHEIIQRDSLSSILTISLLKFIAKYINNQLISKIKSPLKEIIETVKKDMNFTGDPQSDIKAILNNVSGNNIFEYCKYVSKIVTKKELNYIINLLNDKEKIKESEDFWSKLMRFEELNSFFEEELEKALRKSYFDYSVISLTVYENNNRREYLNARKKCPNLVKKLLFHGTQVDPISKIITTKFKYTRKAFYGMGIYFSDMLDYISFYAGGSNYLTRRQSFGKILSAGETFTCIGSEIYYDEYKFRPIYNFDLWVNELDHFPTYEELKEKYPDKMVIKNGIHFAKVEPYQGQVIKKDQIEKEEKIGNFIGTEYVITEPSQYFPLYGLTLERNEYFVIWRDPNFIGENEYKEYLLERKLFLNQKAKMNAYFESSTEEALRLICRKRYNKIILISSIGLDRSGQKFVEIARKILGFNVFVLFFSDNSEHFSWLNKFKNFLYTHISDFFEEYIMNYNEVGLKQLRNKIQKYYNDLLIPDFTPDFLSFPNYIKGGMYQNVKFSDNSRNFRTGKLFNRFYNCYINMDKNGNISVDSYSSSLWDITLDEDNMEITLNSNNFYLYGSKEGKASSFKYMKRGHYKKVGDDFLIIFEGKSLAINSKVAITR